MRLNAKATARASLTCCGDAPGRVEIGLLEDVHFRRRPVGVPFFQINQGAQIGPCDLVSLGEVLGRHSGLHQFTIGQRKGLRVAATRHKGSPKSIEPLYVISLEPQTNRVVVGEDAALRGTACEVDAVNWVSIAPPAAPLRALVKIRHKHNAAPATIEPLGPATARVTFDSPQRAIAPGQAAVFYTDDVVLGGGWIR